MIVECCKSRVIGHESKSQGLKSRGQWSKSRRVCRFIIVLKSDVFLLSITKAIIQKQSSNEASYSL